MHRFGQVIGAAVVSVGALVGASQALAGATTADHTTVTVTDPAPAAPATASLAAPTVAPVDPALLAAVPASGGTTAVEIIQVQVIRGDEPAR